MPAGDELPLARSLLDAIGAPVAILASDGRLLFANRACEEAAGWHAAAAGDRPVWALFADADERAAAEAAFAAAIGGGSPATHGAHPPTGDGGRRPMRWTYTALDGPGDSPRQVIATGTVETGTTAAGPVETGPDTAREREERLRSITQTAPDAIVIIDERGIIDTVNPAAERLFGYSAAELVGRNVKILMPSPHREAHDSHLARYRETGEKRVIGIGRVVVGTRKDGTTFPARLAIGEIALGQGRLFTGFLHDITERENIQRRAGILQQELMHASRLSALGEMASGIAHELNQPLTAVMNYTRAARRRLDGARPGAAPHDAAPPDTAPIVDLVDKAGGQAERAAEIIRRLRTFIKKDDSERRFESINAVVEEAAALALIGASDRRIELIFALEDALPPVLIDRIQVQQVVLNILRNAIEAFEGPGARKVRVATGAAGRREVQVEIGDNGPGLAPGIADDPFRPFQTTKEDGVGIGLAISRTIIDDHGGRLWAESPPEGGAVFRFSLPAGGEADD